jgi:hypothetical protein
VLGLAILFGALILGLGIASTKIVGKVRIHEKIVTAAQTAAPAAVLPILATAVPARERADQNLDREGRSPCAGGTLMVLPDFESSDGTYDLVVHFHGASDLVKQSYAAVKLNAVLCVFNLGTGSGVYDDHFIYKPRFDQVLELATLAMQKRGLQGPKVGRVALSAFSAGVSAIDRILERPSGMKEIDAVIVLDGLHASYDEHKKLDMRRIDPLVKFAELAARGDKLAFITHSEIPTLSYASTHETADALLQHLEMKRSPGGEAPALPPLAALGNERSRKELSVLEPTSHAQKGRLYVRGYAGIKAEHHRSHLHQMATTGLPLLAERWRR